MQMQRMTLFFQPTAEQQAALDKLLVEQQDPTSPNYHKWLTPEEFGDRFGISAQDINTLTAWLRSQGFTVDQTARSRTWIAFSGIAAQVNAAFQTSIHNYLVGGKLHYAAASDPSIPAAFAGVVSGVGALHNFAPHAAQRQRQAARHVFGHRQPLSWRRAISAPSTICRLRQRLLPSRASTAPDRRSPSWAKPTSPPTAIPGAMARPEPRNGQQQQYDVVTFRNLAGLPALTSTNFQIKIVPGTTDPGVVTADADEANLDVEWSGATAPNANLVYVINNPNTSNGAFGALEWAVDNVSANVFSISYGLCEPQVDSTTKSPAHHGWSAGQCARTDHCARPPAIAARPIATPPCLPPTASPSISRQASHRDGDGGNRLLRGLRQHRQPHAATQYWAGSTNDTAASALAYIPETAWNDNTGTTLSATGGGVSTFFTKPSWQTGAGVPNDGQRDVPDISFTAAPGHDGYLICSQSSCVNGYRKGPLPPVPST